MDRALRRMKSNRARIRAVEHHEMEMMQREQQMADTRVKDIEDYIKLIQTRTRALEILRRKFASDPEVAQLLEEIG